jgi:hypothetical protein
MSSGVLSYPIQDRPPAERPKTHVIIGRMRKKCANALRRSAKLRVYCIADFPAGKPSAGKNDLLISRRFSGFSENRSFPEFRFALRFPAKNRKSVLSPIPYRFDRAVPDTYDKSKSACAVHGHLCLFVVAAISEILSPPARLMHPVR